MKASSVVIILFGILLPSSSFDQVPAVENYTNYCSLCHGSNLEGGRASALVKSNVNWKYGYDRKSIIRSIRDGIKNTEMMRWADVLTSEEIESLADFILKAQKKSDPELRNKGSR